MKLFYRKKLSLVSIIPVENEKTFEQLTIATPMRKNKLNIRISPNELQGLFADSHTKSCVSITYTIFRKPILLYHKADMMKRCHYVTRCMRLHPSVLIARTAVLTGWDWSTGCRGQQSRHGRTGRTIFFCKIFYCHIFILFILW